MHLRNEDLSDRELLHLIDDIAQQDERGHVLSQDVIDRVGYSNGSGRAVTSRMSAMGRLGFLERIEARTLGLPASAPPRYIISSEGRALMGGKLNKAVQTTLERADAGTELLIMREIAERGYVRGSQVRANGMRRQWLHSAARRSR